MNRSVTIFIVSAFAATFVMLGGDRGTLATSARGSHSPLRLYGNHSESANWTGYFLATAQTGTKYQSVAGAWTVPSAFDTQGPAQSGSNQEYSSAWIGVGGACLDAACNSIDTSLIQIGTEQDAYTTGSSSYYAWYELSSSGRSNVPNPVKAGDSITASVSCTANCSAVTQSWTLTITDSTQNWTWSNTFSFASSEASAEWIQEPFQSCIGSCVSNTLAYFGQFSFTNLAANGQNPNLTAANALMLLNIPFYGEPSDAIVSSPVNGNSFAVCWGSGSPSSCNFSTSSSPLLAAVLPSSRSIAAGSQATVFATLLNAGSNPLTGCTISGLSDGPTSFSYQTTDAATNLPTGTPNTPVSIGAGGAQSFVLTFGGNNSTEGQNIVGLQFGCAGTSRAPVVTGLNTVGFLVGQTPPPDLVALAATLLNDGVMHINGSSGSGVFAVATTNLGAAAASLNVNVDTGISSLPVTLSVCQTNPTTGVCLAPPSNVISTTVNSLATPTFAVFATATGSIPFNPAVNRVFVRFSAGVVVADGTTRSETVGGTSVAVETQ